MEKLFKFTDYRLQSTAKQKTGVSRRKTADQHQGQIAVVLLLFVLVALTIGLAVTQRSLTNITTSSQTEQVSRAFSAAEAGIETIKSVGITDTSTVQSIPSTDLKNQSQATTRALTQLPKPNQALEYPPVGKDVITQFWLANPTNSSSNWDSNITDRDDQKFFYGGSSINVYFGQNPTPASESTNPPAIEVNLITFDGTNYTSSRTFYDSDSGRRANNGFGAPTSCTVSSINTSNSISSSADRDFLCQKGIPISGTPIMLRARILYSNIKQPVAVGPPSTCTTIRCSLPKQAAIYTSTGTAGQSQKTLQVFRETNFMPSFLDFAVFSSGVIEKQ